MDRQSSSKAGKLRSRRPTRASPERRSFMARLAGLLSVFPTLSLALGVHSKTTLNSALDRGALASNFAGKLTSRTESDYEIWRQSMAWHARKPERYPDLIAHAADENDVVAAVNFARENQLKIAVRCSGHSWVHSGIREGGILLDLARLRKVEIKVEAQSATVQPAVSSRELARQLGIHGLAFPVAHCGSVAMGGYLLGGGQAWNGAAWGGRACFNVNAFDVVLADGRTVRVDTEHHPDLLWLARGVGPAFPGIITRFHLKTYPLPGAITTSSYVFPLARAGAVAEWAQKVAADVPEHVELLMFMAGAPEGNATACGAHGQAFYLAATAFAETTREATRLLKPVKPVALMSDCVLADEFQATPFDALFDWVDQSFSPDRYAADTVWSDDPLATLVNAVAEHFAVAPSAQSSILCEVHPKHHDYPDAAFSMHALTSMICYSVWRSPEDDDINIQWLRDAIKKLEPHTVGRFISETDLLAAPDRAEQSFGSDNWERIQSIRKRYDPAGVFHDYLA